MERSHTDQLTVKQIELALPPPPHFPFRAKLTGFIFLGSNVLIVTITHCMTILRRLFSLLFVYVYVCVCFSRVVECGVVVRWRDVVPRHDGRIKAVAENEDL